MSIHPTQYSAGRRTASRVFLADAVSEILSIPAAVPAAPDLAGRFLSSIAAAIDRLMVGAAKMVIDRTVMPTPDETDAMRRQAEFYRTRELIADPRGFFPFLDRPEPVPDVVVAPLEPGPWNRRRARLVFESPYRPVNPAFAAEHDRLVENHWVHAETWTHAVRPRGTVVLLHGFGMGGSRLDALALMAPALFASGLDVVLVTLPLHGMRSPRTARFSGQLFASPDIVRLNETMAQAAHDVVALVAWLRSLSDAPIGLLGMSLGGYVAALMAGLMPDLDFVIPVVAPVCFGDLAHRFMSSSAVYRDRPSRGLDREELRSAYRIHSPLTHAPRVARERLCIIAARGDRIVPHEHSRWLETHWNHPRTIWFTGSHLAPFGRATVRREIRRFLQDLDVL